MVTRILHFIFGLFGFLFMATTATYSNGSTFHKPKSTYFSENKGQITDQYGISRDDIDFKLSTGTGLNIFIGNGQLHYQWAKANSGFQWFNGTAAEGPSGKPSAPIEFYRMDVVLLGSNPNCIVTREAPAFSFDRYYLPFVNENGIIANRFGRVTYLDIYPKIDWTFYFNAYGKLEHDFIIRPGGNVSDIKISYNGASDIAIDPNGGLRTITPYGEVIEKAPVAYEQESNAPITCAYNLSGNVLSFSAKSINGIVVIDPVVDWGTYFGGTDYDELRQVAIGKDNFVYTVGSTNSSSNIATTGAYQTSFAGGTNFSGSDAMLSKYNQAGNLIWSTYYGGTTNDLGRNIAFDTSGNVYLAGYTNSTAGIASTGAYQTTKLGSASRTEAFLVKFDTSGGRVWGTYFGGAQNEANTAMGLCIDKSNHIYLTGNTNSTSGIATLGAYQTSLSGGSDVFLAQFSTGGALNWCTYYGGAGNESPYSLSSDTAGNVYVSGSTIGSTTGIATTGSFQTSYSATNGEDAFLAKFNSSGQLVWGTYYGDAGIDRAYCSAIDSSGNIYMAGVTVSTSNIATIGSHQSGFGGGTEDGFIAKFNAAGQRQWATYYGGSFGEGILGMHYDHNGSLYITGYTSSSDSISTPGSLEPIYNAGQDAFVSRFDAANGTLVWGSYYGGVDAENGYGVDVDVNGNIFVCGNTVSATGISTGSANQGSFNGGDADGFLLKIKDCIIPQIIIAIQGDTTVCAGSSHTYKIISTDEDSVVWVTENGWDGSSNTDSLNITFNDNNGIIKAVAVNNCYHSDTVSLHVNVNPVPNVPSITSNGNTLTTTQMFTAYQWYRNGMVIVGETGQTCPLTVGGDYTVVVFNALGCSSTSAIFTYTETNLKNLLNSNGITVYPNPVQNVLSIKTPIKSKVEIRDIAGKLLLSEALNKGLNSIGLGQYCSGFYLLRVIGIDGTFLGSCKVAKD